MNEIQLWTQKPCLLIFNLSFFCARDSFLFIVNSGFRNDFNQGVSSRNVVERCCVTLQSFCVEFWVTKLQKVPHIYSEIFKNQCSMSRCHRKHFSYFSQCSTISFPSIPCINLWFFKSFSLKAQVMTLTLNTNCVNLYFATPLAFPYVAEKEKKSHRGRLSWLDVNFPFLVSLPKK